MIDEARTDFWRTLLEAAPDALIVADAAGKLVWANAEAESLFGHARHELVGQEVEVLLPERFRKQHPAFRRGYQQAPQRRPMGAALDLTGLRKDGSEFPIEVRLGPFDTAEGHFVVAAIRDIGAKKRVDDLRHNSLQEAGRLKSDFLAKMSYELRDPLTSIIGFAELMVEERVGPVSLLHREFLNDILSSGHALLRIVNDVFELSKIDAAGTVAPPKPVDVERLLDEVREVVRDALAAKQVRLETQVDPACVQLEIDPVRLKQLLYERLSSALGATERGSVWLRFRADGPDHVRIEVEDPGNGNQPEGKAGAGLALTRRIVEAQGGRTGTRRSPAGNTFYAILPRRPGGVKGPAPEG